MNDASVLGMSCRKSLNIINNDNESFTYSVLESTLYSAGCADHVIVTPMTGTIPPHSRSVFRSLNAIALHRKPVLELQSVTCHVGSYGIIRHPTQTEMNASRLTLGCQNRFTYPGGMEG